MNSAPSTLGLYREHFSLGRNLLPVLGQSRDSCYTFGETFLKDGPAIGLLGYGFALLGLVLGCLLCLWLNRLRLDLLWAVGCPVSIPVCSIGGRRRVIAIRLSYPGARTRGVSRSRHGSEHQNGNATEQLNDSNQ